MPDAERLRLMREGLAELGIEPVVLHTIYLVNLAAADPQLRRKSIAALAEELRRAEAFGAHYVVTHLGSAGESRLSAALARAAAAVRAALRQDGGSQAMLLLENSAGSRNIIGAKFAQLADVMGRVDSRRLGLCFDTAHAFASGYDVASPRGLRETLVEIDHCIGLDKLRIVHLNDSRAALGSQVDRHEHIGLGAIGRQGIRRIIRHPKLRELPFIMETPIERPGDDARNMRRLRQLC